MTRQTLDPAYVLGRTEGEAQRLMLQSRLLDRCTRRFLADAGLAPGMTVLDVGSGAGDVAFAAADLVGPHGRVIGVDLNPVILETARLRAAAEGRCNVAFIAGDCRAGNLPEVDAVIGRFVLFYTGDISETLRAVVSRVRPGGIVAFAEADFRTALDYMRASPAGVGRAGWEWASRAFAGAGIALEMAAPLYQAFLEAGLGTPKMAIQASLIDAEAWDGFRWLAASLRSQIPVFEREGIVSAEQLDIDTFAERAQAEVRETGYPLMFLPVVTAWARRPCAAP